MPFEYKKGHVVDVFFPNDDIRNPGLKIRPCVVLDVLEDTDYILICITGTDWSTTKKGIWIKQNTNEYSKMKLSKPSFINLEDIKKLPIMAIRNYRGFCPIMDKIEELLKTKL